MLAIIAATIAMQASWMSEVNDLGWVRMGESSDDHSVFLARAARPGQIWARFEMQPDSPYLSQVELYQVDCTSGTVMRLQGDYYQGRNLEGGSFAMPREYAPKYPIPGTFAESILNAGCALATSGG